MFEIFGEDLATLWLTVQLASVTTFFLIILGTPLAAWLAFTASRWKSAISALVALPIVLPPTVIGFYLLIFMGPEGPLGRLVSNLGGKLLPFTFMGLVIASIFYSLPFVVQPLQNAFESVDKKLLEAAATLGANLWDQFWTVIIPLSKQGFITATVLGFTHTVGEFGVVMMIGGNIPGETRVVSMQIYEYVEGMNYASAHRLSLFMLVFSFYSPLDFLRKAIQNKFIRKTLNNA